VFQRLNHQTVIVGFKSALNEVIDIGRVVGKNLLHLGELRGEAGNFLVHLGDALRGHIVEPPDALNVLKGHVRLDSPVLICVTENLLQRGVPRIRELGVCDELPPILERLTAFLHNVSPA